MTTQNPAHGPVLTTDKVIPGKWYQREDALPPEGMYVLCVHNRGTWRDDNDPKGVNMVILSRQVDPPGVYQCPNNLGAGYNWEQFGPDSFFAHKIDRWMRPVGIDNEALAADELFMRADIHGLNVPIDSVRTEVIQFIESKLSHGPLTLKDGRLQIYAGTCPYSEEIHETIVWVFSLSRDALDHELDESAQDI